MGSTCCKRFESPYSPKLPDFNQIFLTCAEQFQSCLHDRRTSKEVPQCRKFSASDISGPLPLGMTRPKRPPRKRKCKLTRSTSLVIRKNLEPKLKRSNSIHEIYFVNMTEIFVTPPEPLESQTKEVDKKSFLASLLATEENNNSALLSASSSRRPSITDSLRDFENSLYEMLEEETKKNEIYDESNWRPQIPVMSYH